MTRRRCSGRPTPCAATPDIGGLHLGEVMQPRLPDVVGYLLLASRDPCSRRLDSFPRFQHILAGGFVAHTRRGRARLPGAGPPNYRGFGPSCASRWAWRCLFIKLLRPVTDDEFRITGLDFPRHARPARVGEHRRLFGLLPDFAAAHDAYLVSAALLRRPPRNANPGSVSSCLAACAGAAGRAGGETICSIRLSAPAWRASGARRDCCAAGRRAA